MSDSDTQDQEWWESPDTTVELKFQVRQLTVTCGPMLACQLTGQMTDDFIKKGWEMYRLLYHPQETDPAPVGKVSMEGDKDVIAKPLMEGETVKIQPPNSILRVHDRPGGLPRIGHDYDDELP